MSTSPATLTNLNGWVWIIDSLGNYHYSSSKVEAFLDISPSEIVGSPILSPEQTDELISNLGSTFYHSHRPYSQNITISDGRGKTLTGRLYAWHINPGDKSADRKYGGLIELSSSEGASPARIAYTEIISLFEQATRQDKVNVALDINQSKREVPDPRAQEVADAGNHKKPQKITSFYWMAVPLIGFLLIGAFVIIERIGIPYRLKPAYLKFLDPPAQTVSKTDFLEAKAPQSLLLFDETGIEGPALTDSMEAVFNSLQVPYKKVEVRQLPEVQLDQFQTLVVTFTDLTTLESSLSPIENWVRDGGDILFAIRPDPSVVFQALYRKLGIHSKGEGLVNTQGLTFKTDIIPALKSTNLGSEFLQHTSLPVRVEDSTIIHATSADQSGVPILWEYKLGQGTVVVVNSDQFVDKSSYGFLASAYSILPDVFVYPVINSSVVFLNNFPGPIPSGNNPAIVQQFGRNTESFYMNIWWPDLQAIAQKNNLKYTGLFIGSYGENINPPFVMEGDPEQNHYLGTSLVKMDGELGLQGYNLVPLCRSSELKNAPEIKTWSESLYIRESIFKVYEYLDSLFPEHGFSTYSPPNGILCPETEAWMAGLYPRIRVIASEYLPSKASNGHFQDYIEMENRLISFPIIHKGFEINDYQRWVAANSLMLQYVSSLGLNPNDAMDSEGVGKTGWTAMRDKLSEQIMWLNSSSPGLRSMTASEGAMAVQRFHRILIDTHTFEDRVEVDLTNFYDIAWLLVRSHKEPATIEGGSLTKVGSDLYLIEVEKAKVIIRYKDTK